MLIGIDGTGPVNNVHYEHDNHNSLITQLIRESRQVSKTYLRGPITVDHCGGIVSQVCSLIMAQLKRAPRQKVFLAGHSRGGAICVSAAAHLKKEGLPIDCMVLFDAVDRALLGATVIPSNVEFAYHAVRRSEVGSRPMFGHCGLQIEPPGRLQICPFYATHAGVGGTPWSGVEAAHWKDHPKAAYMTKERDYRGTNEVKTWAWMMMRKHGMV